MAIKFTAGTPENRDFTPVPAGEYTLTILGATEKQSPKGDPMIELKLRPELHNGQSGPHVWDYLVFTSAAKWRIDQFLLAIGAHPGEGETITVEPGDWLGMEVRAKLTIQNDNKGNPRNRVDAYLTVEGF
jgi:hypothetical protein